MRYIIHKYIGRFAIINIEFCQFSRSILGSHLPEGYTADSLTFITNETLSQKIMLS